jgi:nonribosomal peptide synthetase DhbF
MDDIIHSIGHDPRLPDSPLAGLGDEGMTSLINAFSNMSRMTTRVSGKFSGDLLFFPATVGKVGNWLSPQQWSPYVSGTVEVHPIACAHGEMTQPGPLAEVGATLMSWLREKS